MRRGLLAGLAASAAILCIPASTAAHRLDEYLQAARLSIAIDRVDLELDLTPGAAIAAVTFNPIDTDGDQQISSAEGDAYARRVLRALSVAADGTTAAITLVDSRFPELAEVSSGVGVVRLRATVQLAAASPGRHTIAFGNSHLPNVSVYLANAMAPTDSRIAITGQTRDPLQRTLTVDYDVAASGWMRIRALVSGLAIVGMLVYVRRNRRRREDAGGASAGSPGLRF